MSSSSTTTIVGTWRKSEGRIEGGKDAGRALPLPRACRHRAVNANMKCHASSVCIVFAFLSSAAWIIRAADVSCLFAAADW